MFIFILIANLTINTYLSRYKNKFLGEFTPAITAETISRLLYTQNDKRLHYHVKKLESRRYRALNAPHCI